MWANLSLGLKKKLFFIFVLEMGTSCVTLAGIQSSSSSSWVLEWQVYATKSLIFLVCYQL